MKKAIIIILAVVLVVFLCSIIYFGLVDQTRIKDSVKLPNEYYIEYEVLSEEGVLSVVAKGKDSYGNYYYKTSDSETLFILEGDKYIVFDNQNGQWNKRSIYVNYEYIEKSTQEFSTYTDKSTEAFGNVYTKGDDEDYLLRRCESYEVGFSMFAHKQKMLVDADTGICMSFFNISSLGSSDNKESGFECVKFEISNFNFSKYISEK